MDPKKRITPNLLQNIIEKDKVSQTTYNQRTNNQSQPQYELYNNKPQTPHSDDNQHVSQNVYNSNTTWLRAPKLLELLILLIAVILIAIALVFAILSMPVMRESVVKIQKCTLSSFIDDLW